MDTTIEFQTFDLYLSHLQRCPMTIDRNKRRCTLMILLQFLVLMQ